MTISAFREARAIEVGESVALSLAETIWPTRCAICDRPGEVLCAECAESLPFIDQWLACPRCGAPWGLRQCTECNPFSLGEVGSIRLPYEGCVCAVAFDDRSARIPRAHKDAGERRLAHTMAYYIACAIPPEWLPAVVAYIPATPAARLRRGFDHGRSLAGRVAELLDLPCERLLEPPAALDQRGLARVSRFQNLSQALRARRKTLLAPAQRVILVEVTKQLGGTTEKVEPEKKSSSFKVRVSIDDLNIRKGPGTNYAKTGKYTGKGVFTITEVKSGKGSDAGWGKLKSGVGWISLDYAKRI